MNNLKKYIFVASLFSSIFTACGNDTNINGGDPVPVDPTSGDVLIYTTTGSLSHDFKKSYVDFSKTSNMGTKTIKIDESPR